MQNHKYNYNSPQHGSINPDSYRHIAKASINLAPDKRINDNPTIEGMKQRFMSNKPIDHFDDTVPDEIPQKEKLMKMYAGSPVVYKQKRKVQLCSFKQNSFDLKMRSPFSSQSLIKPNKISSDFSRNSSMIQEIALNKITNFRSRFYGDHQSSSCTFNQSMIASIPLRQINLDHISQYTSSKYGGWTERTSECQGGGFGDQKELILTGIECLLQVQQSIKNKAFQSLKNTIKRKFQKQNKSDWKCLGRALIGWKISRILKNNTIIYIQQEIDDTRQTIKVNRHDQEFVQQLKRQIQQQRRKYLGVFKNLWNDPLWIRALKGKPTRQVMEAHRQQPYSEGITPKQRRENQPLFSHADNDIFAPTHTALANQMERERKQRAQQKPQVKKNIKLKPNNSQIVVMNQSKGQESSEKTFLKKGHNSKYDPLQAVKQAKLKQQQDEENRLAYEQYQKEEEERQKRIEIRESLERAKFAGSERINNQFPDAYLGKGYNGDTKIPKISPSSSMNMAFNSGDVSQVRKCSQESIQRYPYVSHTNLNLGPISPTSNSTISVINMSYNSMADTFKSQNNKNRLSPTLIDSKIKQDAINEYNALKRFEKHKEIQIQKDEVLNQKVQQKLEQLIPKKQIIMNDNLKYLKSVPKKIDCWQSKEIKILQKKMKRMSITTKSGPTQSEINTVNEYIQKEEIKTRRNRKDRRNSDELTEMELLREIQRNKELSYSTNEEGRIPIEMTVLKHIQTLLGKVDKEKSNQKSKREYDFEFEVRVFNQKYIMDLRNEYHQLYLQQLERQKNYHN